uniref:BAAT/Acyl-CoA thioester hydrolase C-terminal domain-containing protein n=1 Tax=Cyprinodon variegatus TaxID=28743 RepID=A0A3Q2E071_CYPVA
VVHHPRISLISRSKGGDIALSLAAFVQGVEAVVWINGCSANVGIPLYYKNRQILSPLMFNFSKVIPTESGANIIKYAVEDPLAEENKGSVVPIERANGHFLFVASEDDLNWDSKGYLDDMVERLKRHGKKNFESITYPAGDFPVMQESFDQPDFHLIVRRVVYRGLRAVINLSRPPPHQELGGPESIRHVSFSSDRRGQIAQGACAKKDSSFYPSSQM